MNVCYGAEMQTVTVDDLGLFPPLAYIGRSDDMDTFPHKNCGLEKRSSAASAPEANGG